MRKIIEGGVALVFTFAAVCTDLKTMRVPNGLIVLGVLAGAMLSSMGIRSGGVILFLIRLVLPVVILYPVYLMRGLGAGDIKLIAALSTIMGADLALAVIIYSLFIGAIIGIARWILKGQFLYRLQSIRYGMYDVLLYKQNSAYFTETNKKEKLHFTICIMGAVIICIMKEGME